MRGLVILGSTGSVGRNALAVARSLGGEIRVVGLGARASVDRLLEQAREFDVGRLALVDEGAAAILMERAGDGVAVESGRAGLAALAGMPEADVVLCAIVGVGGLIPSLTALGAGKRLAIASKEILVAAGGLVMAAARCSGAELIPVDSEHSAIFQCLQGQPRDSVRRIILTASGGPFLGWPRERLSHVTVEDALRHPSWEMGPKITVDSATLMNKGLEIIEAHWLFGVPFDRVQVVVHPQSIVHSMVEFVDGTVLAQLSAPDMRYPIQYALTYPSRLPGALPEISFADLPALTFVEPDLDAFPALSLARRAGETGGTMPAVLNAANEVAVDAFLSGSILFTEIPRIVATVLERHGSEPADDVETILRADAWARKEASACIS